MSDRRAVRTPPGAARARRVREAAEILGLRAVLLAYWGTASVLARRRGRRSN
ncbi:hypothetical protein [Streptomyces sp. NPDC060022]|uniref:hypothetical protein n=1 Tax=Streptomyces sp. NPDC060022 TaxID=3347039 RepID=UPI00369EBE24